MEQFIIHSTVEGYWNNEIGWVEDDEDATIYSKEERDNFPLPLAIDGAKWVKIN